MLNSLIIGIQVYSFTIEAYPQEYQATLLSLSVFYSHFETEKQDKEGLIEKRTPTNVLVSKILFVERDPEIYCITNITYVLSL